MKVDKQKSVLQSTMGSLCSLVVLLIVTAYAYQKMDVWMQKKDVDILESTADDYFDLDYIFDYEQGLNIAFGFTEYGSGKQYNLDKSIGKIALKEYSWGGDASNFNQEIQFRDINTHICSSEELGLEGDNSSFMPINKNNLNDVRHMQQKFHCADKEDMKISGTYHSERARLLEI